MEKILNNLSKQEIENFIKNMDNSYIKDELLYFMNNSSETVCINNIIAFGHYNDHPFATYNISTGEIKEYNW